MNIQQIQAEMCKIDLRADFSEMGAPIIVHDEMRIQ